MPKAPSAAIFVPSSETSTSVQLVMSETTSVQVWPKSVERIKPVWDVRAPAARSVRPSAEHAIQRASIPMLVTSAALHNGIAVVGYGAIGAPYPRRVVVYELVGASWEISATLTAPDANAARAKS